MTSASRMTKAELAKLIENVKANDGDPTILKSLEDFMTEVSADEISTKKHSFQLGGDSSITSVGEYWKEFHNLQEPLDLDTYALNLKSDIEEFVQEGLVTLNPDKSLEKHCVLMSKLIICPWSKETCICDAVRSGGKCKMGLLTR